MDKSTVRQEIKAVLCRLSDARIAESSRKITTALLSCDEIASCGSVFVYQSIGFEVRTQELIRELLSLGKTVAVPKIVGKDMQSVLYSDNQRKNSYGIFEPNTSAIGCEVAIVPALAFDRQLNRLGRGGGYYDRFLSANSLIKIGIAYDIQLLDKLCALPHDVKMDKIITETEILTR